MKKTILFGTLFACSLSALCVQTLHSRFASRDDSWVMVPSAIERAKEVHNRAKIADIAYKNPYSLKKEKRDMWTAFTSNTHEKIHPFSAENEGFYYNGKWVPEHSGFVQEKEDGSLDISFKGTTNLGNVVNDLTGIWAFDKATQTRVHNGFLLHWRAMRKSVMDIVSTIANQRGVAFQDLKVNFAGHSLGGAAAQLAALDFHTNTMLNINSVSTFGAPVCFDIESANLYNQKLGAKTETFYQNEDLITYLSAQSLSVLSLVRPPLLGLGLLFSEGQHVGHQIAIKNPERSIHSLKGYLKNADPVVAAEPGGTTFVPTEKSSFRKVVDTVRALPSRCFHRLHKGAKPIKDGLKRLFGFRSRLSAH